MERPIQKLLIANRGEIACRIMRTCEELGIRTVAVYSEADRRALHVETADEAVFIGQPEARFSYLDGTKVIDAAKRTGADAIHPGYGFLSENAAFAEAVIDAGLVWVGPHPKAMRDMGSKTYARRLAKELGVPVVPGYDGDDQTQKALTKEAKAIGFPLMIKASAGGGGKGIRIVRDEKQFPAALKLAKQEAQSAFGDDRVIVERYVEEPRHVEVQVMGDKHGNLVHMFTRDCSVQRRHQKLIEEAPAPNLLDDVREAMHEAALTLARAIEYDNAGTVEFLYDTNTQNFYFLEMNTRLQVEHPVTEEITGLDLVELQLVAAWGGELSVPQRDGPGDRELLRDFLDVDDDEAAALFEALGDSEPDTYVLEQDDIEQSGVAIEVRLCAEIPEEDFRPSSGEIVSAREPFVFDVNPARIDTGVRSGGTVSPYYDSLLMKVIAYGPNRDEAVRQLVDELEERFVIGIPTNQNYLRDVVAHDAFAAGDVTTHFIERYMAGWQPHAIDTEFFCVAAAAAYAVDIENWRFHAVDNLASPWETLGSWRLLQYAGVPGWSRLVLERDGKRYTTEFHGRAGQYEVTFDGVAHSIRIDLSPLGARSDAQDRIEIDGISRRFGYVVRDDTISIAAGGEQAQFRIVPRSEQYVSDAHASAGSLNDVIAPYPGLITEVLVKPGDTVEAGDALVVMEAMKMIQHLSAQAGGVIKSVYCQAQQTVDAGALLVEFEKELTTDER